MIVFWSFARSYSILQKIKFFFVLNFLFAFVLLCSRKSMWICPILSRTQKNSAILPCHRHSRRNKRRKSPSASQRKPKWDWKKLKKKSNKKKKSRKKKILTAHCTPLRRSKFVVVRLLNVPKSLRAVLVAVHL